MANLNYPDKPWSDGQRAELLPGMQFIFSSSLRKWVPISPGTSSRDQLLDAFGVRTAEEVNKLFDDVGEIQSQVESVQTQLTSRGKVWKTANRPTTKEVKNNDVWIDQETAKLFFYNESADSWIQLLPST